MPVGSPASAAAPAPPSASPPGQFFPPPIRRRVLLAMLIVYGGGVLAHAWAPLRPLAFGLTTPLLVLSNAAVLLAILDDERARALRWWCVAAWAITVALEIAGVATGRVFGPYHYGATLRGQVAGVPLLIGLNWTTLLLGAVALIERAWPAHPRAAGPVLAAALLTGFDWVMEPVAVALDYWQWHTAPRIPAQNYVAWFGIALGLAAVLAALRLRVRTALAAAFFGVQLAFFVLLRLVGGA